MKEISLSKGKFAIVDDEDFEYLSQFKWYCNHNRAIRKSRKEEGEKRKTIHMHREVLARKLNKELPSNMFVDHIDKNSLNNCRDNLRPATITENNRNRSKHKNNSSGFRGISKQVNNNGKYQYWQVRIRIGNGKRLFKLFPYTSAGFEAAVAWRIEQEEKYFGEFKPS